MVKELYSEEDVRELSSGMWKNAALSISLVVAAVAIGVVSCFFVTDANANILKYVNIALSSVCGCVALYVLLNGVAPKKARKNYISKVLDSESELLRGVVTGKGKTRIAAKYIKFCELFLTDEEGNERTIYWDMEIGEPEFEGAAVEFSIVKNKIIGYGDAQ